MKIHLESLGIVEELELFPINTQRLLQEMEDVLNKYPLCPLTQQLSLVHRQQDVGGKRYYSGLGSLWNKEKTGYLLNPTAFDKFNDDLKGGEVYRIYKALTEVCPLKIGRVRVMARPPGTSTSLHVDDSSRFHIPLITNPQCVFEFRDHGQFYMPKVGQLYFFDAEEFHCAINNGDSLRVHLIFDTIPPDYAEYLENK